MAAALERKRGGGDGGVHVRVGGRDDVRHEAGIVATAVLCVEDEREVERLRLELGVLAVLADEAEQVLRRSFFGIGVTQHEGVAQVVVGLRAVRVGGDRRERGDQPHGLAEVRLEVEGVGVLVVGVGGQHRARDGVHQVLAGGADDGLLLEAVGQAAILGEDLLPVGKLLLGREPAEQEQVGAFLEAEPVVLLAAAHQVHHVEASVEQLAWHGLLLAFGHNVAVHVADAGEAHQHASAVGIAQTPLNAVLVVQRGVDRVHFPHVFCARGEEFRVYHLLISCWGNVILYQKNAVWRARRGKT